MSDQSLVIIHWEVPLPQAAEHQRAARRRPDPAFMAAEVRSGGQRWQQWLLNKGGWAC